MCGRAELLAWAPLQAVPVPTSRDALTSCEIHFAKSVVALPAATAVGALTAATARARPILGNA